MMKLSLDMPAVVDKMKYAVALACGVMPERVYVVGRDGRIVYKGGVGPMFFRPKEWAQAIAGYLEPSN